MIVYLDTNAQVGLLESDNFKEFRAVMASATNCDQLRDAFEDIGHIENDTTAWVSESWVREISGRSGDVAWNSGLLKMIDYAKANGWWNEERRLIRAHIQRETAS